MEEQRKLEPFIVIKMISLNHFSHHHRESWGTEPHPGKWGVLKQDRLLDKARGSTTGRRQGNAGGHPGEMTNETGNLAYLTISPEASPSMEVIFFNPGPVRPLDCIEAPRMVGLLSNI